MSTELPHLENPTEESLLESLRLGLPCTYPAEAVFPVASNSCHEWSQEKLRRTWPDKLLSLYRPYETFRSRAHAWACRLFLLDKINRIVVAKEPISAIVERTLDHANEDIAKSPVVSKLNMHYDAWDNILVQVHGRKEVVVLDRAASYKLGGVATRHLGGIPIPDNVPHHRVILEPGQALVLPTFCYHSVTSLTYDSVSINCFLEPFLWRGPWTPMWYSNVLIFMVKFWRTVLRCFGYVLTKERFEYL